MTIDSGTRSNAKINAIRMGAVLVAIFGCALALLAAGIFLTFATAGTANSDNLAVVPLFVALGLVSPGAIALSIRGSKRRHRTLNDLLLRAGISGALSGTVLTIIAVLWASSTG